MNMTNENTGETTNSTTNTNQHDALRELHGLLIRAMAEKLKSGEEVKASYLDTVRKFLLDNDVRVENPDEYMEQLQAMMGDGDGGEDGDECLTQVAKPNGYYGPNGWVDLSNDDAPAINDPMAAYDHLTTDKPKGRTGTEEQDGYGFQM